MNETVGVRFKRAGQISYFDPAGISLEVSDYVVVSTNQGLKLGQVAIAPRQVVANEIPGPFKPVVRKAEPEDLQQAEEITTRESEALIEGSNLISKLNLPMKLLSADYNLDGSRLTIHFKAAKRVDFRQLVQELSQHLKARVELRQVGPRDEAKLVGGFGKCGRPLCCTKFLSEFAPVSIKMAKDQDLPLNPMKISGVCGRLQCCLVYESSQYQAMKRNMPKKGLLVSTPMGKAIIIGNNLLKETVLVELECKATAELPLTSITMEGKPSQEQSGECTGNCGQGNGRCTNPPGNK